MKFNNFHYSLSLLDTMYGINIQEEDFEEIALIGWQLIGNKRTKLYRYTVCVDDCAVGVELPCNCDILEAVTTDFEEFNYVTNFGTDYVSHVTEQYIESRKAFKDPLYASGKFIKFERVGNMLYFDKPHGKINILYKGLVLDDDGLPEITDKEAMALATYCAWIIKYKEGLKTNNTNTMNMALNLKKLWSTQCDQARIDYEMTQNDWDNVLDAKTNWGRKLHGKSLKVFR